MRGLPCKRVEVDEIWAFNYCKQRSVATAKAAPEQSGDIWTWTAIDADTKLAISWLIGSRDAEAARVFMGDVASPAMAAGISDTLWDVVDLVRMIEEWEVRQVAAV